MTISKTKVPHLKLVVDNGKVIDEIEEAKEKQKSLIKHKITLQTQLQILKATEESVVEEIDKLETIINKERSYAKGDTRTT